MVASDKVSVFYKSFLRFGMSGLNVLAWNGKTSWVVGFYIIKPCSVMNEKCPLLVLLVAMITLYVEWTINHSRLGYC